MQRKTIGTLDKIKYELKPYLVDYLQSQGIEASVGKPFSCINPEHEDKNPSCSIVGGDTEDPGFHCFSCGKAGDIFQAAHLLENLPTHDKGFIENVSKLAKQFDKEMPEMRKLSAEELKRIQMYRAYHAASMLITSQKDKNNKNFDKVLKERKWKKKICLKHHIGCVENFEKFKRDLINCGFKKDFLEKANLMQSMIFNENSLIFTVKDERGKPVGFSSRNLLYDKSKPGKKYYNSSTSDELIYKKGSRLYGLNYAISMKETNPLWIFEGYADWLTAIHYGMYNCCAIGGTAFTDQHIDLLKSLGIRNVVLCLDGDTKGSDKAKDLLDTKFAGHRDLHVEMALLPDGLDPDNLIKERGTESLYEIERYTAFHWRLEQFDDREDPQIVGEKMIPFIANEPSYIQQEKLCKQLSERIGISIASIQAELHRVINEQSIEKASEMVIVADRVSRDITKSPHDVKTILQNAVSEIETLEKKYNTDILSTSEVLANVQEIELKEINKTEKFDGYNLGSFTNLQMVLSGDWRAGHFMALGGKPNHGKTSFLAQLALQMAENNDDVVVIYHTIDDSLEQFIHKPLAVIGRRYYDKITLNKISNPNYYISKGESSDLLTARKKAYDEFFELVTQSKFIVKDATHGTTLSFCESMLKYYREKFPDKDIIYFVDNFHLLKDFSGHKDERVRFKSLSNYAKNLATSLRVTILATMEYKKVPEGIKPWNSDLLETGAIEYDTTFIGHLYNELSDIPSAASYVWKMDEMTYKDSDEHSKNVILKPIIEIGIGKNKITENKSPVFYKFIPEQGYFAEIEPTVVREKVNVIKEALNTAVRESKGKGVKWNDGRRVDITGGHPVMGGIS